MAAACSTSEFLGIDLSSHQIRVGQALVDKLGLKNLRVRSEGDTARIELPAEEIKQFVLSADLPEIVTIFQEFGFVYVTLDLEGYRSGKLNQLLLTVNS